MERDQEEEAAFAEAGQHIKAFRNTILKFANTLASCYTNNNNNHKSVTALRTNIIHNTQLYRTVHLKSSVEFITSLRNVIMASFTDDVRHAAGYKAQARHADYVHYLHISLLASTKELLEQAVITAKMLETDARNKKIDGRHQDFECKNHEKKALNGDTLAVMIAMGSVVLVPAAVCLSLVGFTAAALAGGYAVHHELLKTAASYGSDRVRKDAEGSTLAAQEIAGPISTCITLLVDAIFEVTGFFARVNNQLQSFRNEIDRILNYREKEEWDGRMNVHFVKMRRPAENLLDLCESFLQVTSIVCPALIRICGRLESHDLY